MAARRMHSIIAVLMVIVIMGVAAICSMTTVDALVDPSASEENAKAATAQENDSSKSKKKTKTTTESSDSQSTEQDSSDDDVVDENAFSTPGNGSLGDVIRDSDSKDFYTIRTENDNTYYLVIDHSGNMDNVYLLSIIDENDLKDFLEDEENISGSVVLPETDTTETQEPQVETTEKEPEKNRLSGIISLAVLIAMAIAGAVFFKQYRRRNEEAEEDYTENMEDDGLPTVNEDEEFLE